jgi:hypothetical protein
VFTARYGLIPYMKHVTFRLLKVNVAYGINCTRTAPKLRTRAVQSYGASKLPATTTTTTSSSSSSSSSSSPQNTPLPFHCSTCTPHVSISHNHSSYLRFHRVAVFVRRPGSTIDTNWNTCIAPFNNDLWLAVLCAMLLLTVALTVTFKIGLHIVIERSDSRACYSFHDSLLYVFGCICQQGLYVVRSLKYRLSKLLNGLVTATLFLEAVTPCIVGAIGE